MPKRVYHSFSHIAGFDHLNFVVQAAPDINRKQIIQFFRTHGVGALVRDHDRTIYTVNVRGISEHYPGKGQKKQYGRNDPGEEGQVLENELSGGKTMFFLIEVDVTVMFTFVHGMSDYRNKVIIIASVETAVNANVRYIMDC